MTIFQIPTSTGQFGISVEDGNSVVLLGPNGSGKTRLGVFIEINVGRAAEVHRIGAHRSLNLNTNIQPPNLEIATNRLLYGYDQGSRQHRNGSRWQGKPATILLSDFEHVVAALYAEENDISVKHRQTHLANRSAEPPRTKLDALKGIWDTLLPHRELIVLAGDIKVRADGSEFDAYDAAELSDGERVIFYLIGQVLLTKPNTLIIVDEPELHVNRSILPRLWDAIEAARRDCSFVYLTHDIDFTVSRRAAAKYAINSYEKGATGEQWEIDPIPSDTGIPDDVVTRIVGSRLPVLFVEGDGGSLDTAFYRRVYDDFTPVAVGSCESVIHAVASFEKHRGFHRLGCAGLIDADGRDKSTLDQLAQRHVFALGVTEVENLLLLPKAFLALAGMLHFGEAESQKRLDQLKQLVLGAAGKDAERYALDTTRRRIDGELKRIGLKSKSAADLETEYAKGVADIKPMDIYNAILADFHAQIVDQDYEGVVRAYDNKGLLAEAARILGLKSRRDLEEFVVRAINSAVGLPLVSALTGELPNVHPRRLVGILAYGSLIDEPGEEIAATTTRTMKGGITTPFPVEFARSSSSRGGAPTLVPVEAGGSRVRAQIFVLADTVTVMEAKNMLWRRETRKAGTYTELKNPGPNNVVINELLQFHGIGVVLYTKIGANIEPLTAERLAELGIASAKAVAEKKLNEGRDGLTYLENATRNGIETALSSAYTKEVLRSTSAPTLNQAIQRLVYAKDETAA